MRASRTCDVVVRARATLLGLFFILLGPGCVARTDVRAIARAYDRADGTGLYTWLVDHEPSAIVAWNIPVARLRSIVPTARIEAARGPNPCRQAGDAHAALVTILAGRTSGRERDLALDCGIALFADSAGLAIAPR